MKRHQQGTLAIGLNFGHMLVAQRHNEQTVARPQRDAGEEFSELGL